MIKKDIPNGTSFENENLYIFFGNKNFDNSSAILNQKKFIFGHQTHEAHLKNIDTEINKLNSHGSLTLIESSDGLFTRTPLKKLAIYTADCIPCFIFSKDRLFSLHLGWRSIEKGLFNKALSLCDQNSQIFIGPHIKQKSFEVQSDVVELLKSHSKGDDSSWLQSIGNNKFKVSLEIFLQNTTSDKSLRFNTLDVDTFKSDQHHSFRRDNNTKGRNISFAFIKNRV